MMIKKAIKKGLKFLQKQQLKHGEFEGFIADNMEMLEGKRDHTVFITTFVLHCLEFFPEDKEMKMVTKGKDFLIREMTGPGLWSYWSSQSGKKITPDLDDTCCVSYALRKTHPYILFRRNLPFILKNKDDRGRFKTWIRDPQKSNDIDSVVNANVLLYTGQMEETQKAIDYLIEVIQNKTEKESTWYYLHPLTLYYALSRAAWSGVSSLMQVKQDVLDRTMKYLEEETANTLHIALGLNTLFNFSHTPDEVMKKRITFLLKEQDKKGGWPNLPFYGAPEPPTPKNAWHGAPALTTALCLEALLRYEELIAS